MRLTNFQTGELIEDTKEVVSILHRLSDITSKYQFPFKFSDSLNDVRQSFVVPVQHEIGKRATEAKED